MKTKFIAISECKEGVILAENAANRFGAVIVTRNTELNGYIINRLTELGVQQVKIYESCNEDDGHEENDVHMHIKKGYEQSILVIKSIVNELAAGKPLDVSKINDISDTVYSGIHDSTYIIKMLNEEKNFDEYTYMHSMNVAFYSMLIGKWLRLDDDSLKDLVKAGLLHDIGKTKVPVEILNKKTRLSDEEFEIIKKHTLHGYDIVESTNCFSTEVSNAVLFHHEREDKSGYPFGIGSRQVDKYAKVIAVADVYDAMTSDRVYKKRTTPFEVFKVFQTIGVKNFNLKIVKAFLTNLSACYVGSRVMLNTGEIGEIVYIPLHSITEPVISVGSDYLDLSKKGDKHILSML